MPIPPFENDWITDRVKAGRNPLSKEDVDSLAADGITHVLDLRESHEWEPPQVGQEALDAMTRAGIVRLNLPIEDMCAPSLDTLGEAVRFIDAALDDPKARVYVHCHAGIERTACVLVAWYAHAHAVDFKNALAALRRKRDALSPGNEQSDVAREWIRVRKPS